MSGPPTRRGSNQQWKVMRMLNVIDEFTRHRRQRACHHLKAVDVIDFSPICSSSGIPGPRSIQ